MGGELTRRSWPAVAGAGLPRLSSRPRQLHPTISQPKLNIVVVGGHVRTILRPVAAAP